MKGYTMCILIFLLNIFVYKIDFLFYMRYNETEISSVSQLPWISEHEQFLCHCYGAKQHSRQPDDTDMGKTSRKVKTYFRRIWNTHWSLKVMPILSCSIWSIYTLIVLSYYPNKCLWRIMLCLSPLCETFVTVMTILYLKKNRSKKEKWCFRHWSWNNFQQ